MEDVLKNLHSCRQRFFYPSESHPQVKKADLKRKAKIPMSFDEELQKQWPLTFQNPSSSIILLNNIV